MAYNSLSTWAVSKMRPQPDPLDNITFCLIVLSTRTASLLQGCGGVVVCCFNSQSQCFLGYRFYPKFKRRGVGRKLDCYWCVPGGSAPHEGIRVCVCALESAESATGLYLCGTCQEYVCMLVQDMSGRVCIRNVPGSKYGINSRNSLRLLGVANLKLTCHFVYMFICFSAYWRNLNGIYALCVVNVNPNGLKQNHFSTQMQQELNMNSKENSKVL